MDHFSKLLVSGENGAAQKAKGSRFLRMMGVLRLMTIRFYRQQADCMCFFFVICVVIRTSYIRYQIPYFNPEHSLFDIS